MVYACSLEKRENVCKKWKNKYIVRCCIRYDINICKLKFNSTSRSWRNNILSVKTVVTNELISISRVIVNVTAVLRILQACGFISHVGLCEDLYSGEKWLVTPYTRYVWIILLFLLLSITVLPLTALQRNTCRTCNEPAVVYADLYNMFENNFLRVRYFL